MKLLYGTGNLAKLSAMRNRLEQLDIKAKLDEGCPIIVNVGPGDFTDSGHFMTLTGYDSEGFTINDSNSRTNSEKHWTYAQMYGQVRNLWAMYI